MTMKAAETEHPALRLARYLKEFVGLRTTTVRDVAQYDSVLWFGDMPQERDCWSSAWIDSYDSAEPWLEVRKQQFEKPPAPPESIHPWVDERALNLATLEIPGLMANIQMPDHEVELAEGESPPLIEHLLVEHPEVESAYDQYRPRWEAWSQEHRRREAIQKVYVDLFRLYTQVRKEGEIVEVVLGIGLLDWRAKLNERVIPIRRHAFVANVDLEFDPANGVMRIVPPGDGAHLRIEDDMLEAELRPDREQYGIVQALIEEIGDDIWDTTQMQTALRSWASMLSADSEWWPGLGARVDSGNRLAMSFAPALILRKRIHTGMVRIYDTLIDQLSLESPEVPELWAGLINDATDQGQNPGWDWGQPNRQSAPNGPPPEVYFPLPANREQRRIVDAIDRERGVLVQGPPGTGKSHTIANLICHLLATGKRVLITAETARALRVLKKMLPEELQPLCVSLLGQGGDAFAEINTAVQGITARHATYTPGAYDNRIAEIDRDLDEARRHQAKLDSEILSLRAEETEPQSVAQGSYSGTASAIAERVANERERFGWMRLPREADPKAPLTNQEVTSWIGIRRRYADNEIADAQLQFPPSADLPDPTQFAATVATEREALAELAQRKEVRSHAAYASIHAVDADARKHLEVALRLVGERRHALDRVASEWQPAAVQELIAGRRAHWDAVVDLSKIRLAELEPLLDGIHDRQVTLPHGHDPRKVRADVQAALSYLNEGGTWKRLAFFTPKQLKDRVYLKDAVLVDGLGASDITKLEVVRDHLEIEFALEEMHSAWDAVGVTPPVGDRRIVVAVLKEQLSVLEQCCGYVDECHGLARFMAAQIPPIPEPDWLDSSAETLLDLVDAAGIEDRYGKAADVVNSVTKGLVGLKDLHDAHTVVQSLIDAVESRDVNAYSQSYARVVSIEATRDDQHQRIRIENTLLEAVPGLVERVVSTLDNVDWDDRLDEWEEAWQWAFADAWLDKRSDFAYQQKLWERRIEVEKEIGVLLAQAAAQRAWKHFFERLSRPQEAALRGWREAVRAMGRGTGRSARLARLRQEARRYMDACRDAIPVWIMPRYLVAEMVNPKPGSYDIIIVDEASQLGVESLFLFYIGKAMVVVGDDQQISPYGVGIADEAIAGLQNHYLDEIPHKHALSAQSSLYANAKIRFRQQIVLREHFRCMPEIIQFSNDLCYASSGTPLDPIRAYPTNRLNPLVLRHVEEGYRTGGPQHAQNLPEAEAIVSQIAACIEDPRYAGASMGVISLQGDAQAKIIERMIQDVLGPEIIEERRLLCGDAYAFQGDERNVIFLSMVAAPGERRIGVLAGESARQRFNVAASRAQDQLWLFHTATLDVLSDACMRHRLLSYMLNPARQTSEESEQRFESKFERDVFHMVTERGFPVRTQVSVGDPTNQRYRIDLVVEGMQGRLAVECDGDQWHGPDRYEHDMARQRDLERAGWQIVHIRGGDFYRDPAKAMELVWSELDRLGITPGGIDQAAAIPPEPLAMEVPEGNQAELVGTEVNEPPSARDEPEPEIRSVAIDAAEDTRIFSQEINARESVGEAIELEPIQSSSLLRRHPETRPQDGTAAGICYPYVHFEGKAGPDPRHASLGPVAEGLCQIIEVEGPMLAKRAYDIYLRGCGIRKLGRDLQRSMNRALQHAIQRGEVVVEDESDKGSLVYSIVRSAGAPPVIVRDRGSRVFEEIPPSELQLVAFRLAEDSGLETLADAHLRAILEFFDLKRLTVQVGTTLLDILGRQYPYVDEIIRRSGE